MRVRGLHNVTRYRMLTKDEIIQVMRALELQLHRHADLRNRVFTQTDRQAQRLRADWDEFAALLREHYPEAEFPVPFWEIGMGDRCPSCFSYLGDEPPRRDPGTDRHRLS